MDRRRMSQLNVAERVAALWRATRQSPKVRDAPAAKPPRSPGAICQKRALLFLAETDDDHGFQRKNAKPLAALKWLSTAPLSSSPIRLLDSITCAPERSFYTGFCGDRAEPACQQTVATATH